MNSRLLKRAITGIVEINKSENIKKEIKKQYLKILGMLHASDFKNISHDKCNIRQPTLNAVDAVILSNESLAMNSGSPCKWFNGSCQLYSQHKKLPYICLKRIKNKQADKIAEEIKASKNYFANILRLLGS